MSFQGSLSELSLPDVIQLVASSGKTGCFHLTDGEVKGEIYLREGRIVHAQVEDLSGEEAVYQLTFWSRGEFRFEAGATTRLRPMAKAHAGWSLASNAFNFSVLGDAGFATLRQAVDGCTGYELEYGDLDAATALLAGLAESA